MTRLASFLVDMLELDIVQGQYVNVVETEGELEFRDCATDDLIEVTPEEGVNFKYESAAE